MVSLIKGGGSGEEDEGRVRWAELNRRDREIPNLSILVCISCTGFDVKDKKI